MCRFWGASGDANLQQVVEIARDQGLLNIAALDSLADGTVPRDIVAQARESDGFDADAPATWAV